MPKTNQTPASVILSLMDEYHLNPFSLSKAINLNPSTVRYIFTGKSKISAPVALRLSKFFGEPPAYWLDLQRAADLSEAAKDKELKAILAGITKAKKPTAAEKARKRAKSSRKTTLADKRKKAAKKPGAKPARGRRRK